jgi:hypothetical protein
MHALVLAFIKMTLLSKCAAETYSHADGVKIAVEDWQSVEEFSLSEISANGVAFRFVQRLHLIHISNPTHPTTYVALMTQKYCD